jgi:NADH:ubiquinone oxidoreductase subunit 4 (subunit M)
MMKKIVCGLGVLPFLAMSSFAQAVEYFELPADFQANAILTITTAVGVILGALVVLWAVRKVIKTTNRS